MSITILGKNYHIETTIILDLTYKNLTNLPTEIGKLVNLKKLYLNHNQLSSLPAEICKLVNLQYLFLNDNQLNSLPEEISKLVNLQVLHLEDNQLSSLPAEISKFINLQMLCLYNNKLKSLPVEILKIKEKIWIDETSYEINNLSLDTEILIFRKLSTELTNLPISLKEIWLKEGIDENLIKVPFGCEIKYY